MVTFGSRGDAEPFRALAARMAADGHAVRLVSHAPFVADPPPGVEPRPVRGRSVRELMDAPEGRALVAGVRNPLRAVRRLATFLEPELRLLYADTAAGVAGADVVVCSPATFPALHAAEAAGVPVVQAQLQPLVPTGAFPAPVAWARWFLSWAQNSAL
nr:glycosyltransferase [Patulibacter sp. SYSU D01012]